MRGLDTEAVLSRMINPSHHRVMAEVRQIKTQHKGEIFMHKTTSIIAIAFSLICYTLSCHTLSAETSVPLLVHVESGVVQFESPTNLPVTTVHGKALSLHAEVRANCTSEALEISDIQARVSVKSITTGMGLRDEHMRKHIFTKTDGSQPGDVSPYDGAGQRFSRFRGGYGRNTQPAAAKSQLRPCTGSRPDHAEFCTSAVQAERRF
ncbi:MAG: hypothetical protein EXQ56_05865 [Acidobacteria bacterium]|nr:hypothetical protein [Acidobacteriota bacterium]